MAGAPSGYSLCGERKVQAAGAFWFRFSKHLLLTAGFARISPGSFQCEEGWIMSQIEFMGKSFEINEEGFISSFDSWSPEWTEYVKELEGIGELTEEHWRIIHMLRDYYSKHGLAPMIRILCRATGLRLREVYELFPSGPGNGACKMAGLPKRTGCI